MYATDYFQTAPRQKADAHFKLDEQVSEDVRLQKLQERLQRQMDAQAQSTVELRDV